MNVNTLLVSTLILILISSCSGTYKAVYQSFNIALDATKGATKTLEEVKQSTSIDLISVKRDGRNSVIVALAYIENGQYKWVSADLAMLIIENGRLIRSFGLDDNLLYLSNTENDPLKYLPHNANDEPQKQPWSRVADQVGDQYGYPLESTFSQAQKSTVQALGLSIETTLYVESVDYKAPSNYVQLHNSWQNHFWYAENGELIKSIQKSSPLSKTLEITYLSRIARLNN